MDREVLQCSVSEGLTTSGSEEKGFAWPQPLFKRARLFFCLFVIWSVPIAAPLINSYQRCAAPIQSLPSSVILARDRFVGASVDRVVCEKSGRLDGNERKKEKNCLPDPELPTSSRN